MPIEAAALNKAFSDARGRFEARITSGQADMDRKLGGTEICYSLATAIDNQQEFVAVTSHARSTINDPGGVKDQLRVLAQGEDFFAKVHELRLSQPPEPPAVYALVTEFIDTVGVSLANGLKKER